MQLRNTQTPNSLLGDGDTRSTTSKTRSGKTRGLSGPLEEKKRIRKPKKEEKKNEIKLLIEKKETKREGKAIIPELRNFRDIMLFEHLRSIDPSIFEGYTARQFRPVIDRVRRNDDNIIPEWLYPRSITTDAEAKAVPEEVKMSTKRALKNGSIPRIQAKDEEDYQDLYRGTECKIKEGPIHTEYRNIFSGYEYVPVGWQTNVTHFLNCMAAYGGQKIATFKRKQKVTVKFYIAIEITFENSNGDHIRRKFESSLRRINTINQIEEKFQEQIDEIWEHIDVFNAGGSGQAILRINVGYVNVARENPAYRSRGGSYIPKPEEFKNQKGVCNVKNKDNECFKWSVLACLHPQTKNGDLVSKYSKWKDELKFPSSYDSKAGMSSDSKQITKFEELNNLAVFIYSKNKKNGVFPIRSSQRGRLENPTTVPIYLWYIEGEGEYAGKYHYIAITNFKTFMHEKSDHSIEHCPYCLNRFSSKDKLQKHLSGPLCIKEGDSPTRLSLPKKGTKDAKISFKKTSEWKQNRFPVVIYADTESLLKKPSDSKEYYNELNNQLGFGLEKSGKRLYDEILEFAGISHTKILCGETLKYESHEISSHCYHIVFEEKFAKKYKQQNKTVLHRGGDSGLNLLDRLMRDCRFYNSLIKTTKTETITEDGEVEVKKTRNEDYKNIPPVQIKIPVFLHNLSGYDAHHILLELSKVCQTVETTDEKGVKKKWSKKISCIPKSGEKFVSFEADGVVFKDSMSFLLDSLENLANNLKIKADYKGRKEIEDADKGLKGDAKKLPEADKKYWIEKCGSWENAANEITKMFTQTRGFYREWHNNFSKNGNKYCYTYERMMKLTSKGSYPYSYFDSFDRFKEDKIPPVKNFCSSLDECIIIEKDGPIFFNTPSDASEHAIEQQKRACELYSDFKCSNLGEYSDMYLRTDTLILADVFESFRTIALEKYQLDPALYYTLPGYSWDALLKTSKVKLDLFTDGEEGLEMLLFAEACVRGGISMIPNRYGEGYNRYTKKEFTNERKDESYIVYYDANGLYSSAMCSHLPTGDYKWIRPGAKFDSITQDILKMKIPNDNSRGYMVEVDIHTPEDLHDLMNDYPCAPEPVEIKEPMMSDFALKLKRVVTNLQRKRTGRKEVVDLGATDGKGQEKLVCRLTPKEKYVVDYRTLQTYISLGLVVTKFHRILSYKQSPWMKPFIEMNIDMRKLAKNDFENAFYKLVNNAVFGKTMENVRKRKSVDLIVDKEILQKRLNSYKCGTWDEIKGGLIIMNVHQEELKMNKPIIIGATILDISKITMYDFHYKVMKKKYGDNVKLLFTDTDSLCYEIKYPQSEGGGNYYSDALSDPDLISRLDTSCYGDIKEDDCKYRHAMYNHPIFGGKKTKGVLGKFKDEIAVKLPMEFVGLRAKMYSLKMAGGKEKGTAKGVKKKAKDAVVHKYYKECLFAGAPGSGIDVEKRCQQIKFNVIRSHKHQLFSETITKVSLCAADDKFYQLSDTEKLAYGHWRIAEMLKNKK